MVVAVITLLLVVISRTNRNLERYHQQEVLASDQQELSSVFTSMDTLASQVAANMELLNFFIPLKEDENIDNYFSTNLMDSIRAGSLLAAINSTDNMAMRISVFNENGDYVSTGSLYETQEVINNTLLDATIMQMLDQAFADAPRQALIWAPHADMWSDNADIQLFTLVRPLTISYSSKIYGYIAVQQNVEAINTLPMWARGDGASYALLSAEGDNIAPDDISNFSENFLPALSATENSDSFTTVLNGQKYTVLSEQVAMADWTLLRMLPSRLLDAPYSDVYTQLTLLGTLLLAILLFVVYLLADKISRPLREFSAGIERISLENLTIDTPLLSGNNAEELQALDRTFRSMLLKLNQSIGFEMKAYMAALQSQMNPHFLYNMLSAIIESADEDGSTRTVKMCEKLSSMLRYMVDYTNDQVLLREEIANMRDYLDLMKVRYEEHFNYEVETCEALEDLRIPRMILQPLTENCFQHGFKTSRPPWHILVRFSCTQSKWCIEVIDNGGGVADAEVKKIHEKIEAYQQDIAAKYSQLRLGGMGLVNTVLRLRLSQHEHIFFKIEAVPSGGTRVVIGGGL